jgi:hypothetical protein
MEKATTIEQTLDNEGPCLSSITPRGKVSIDAEASRDFEASLSSDWDCNPPTVELQQLLAGVYFIDNVLSVEECSNLINLIDNSASLSFWCAEKVDDGSTRAYRNAETIEMHSRVFAEKLWARVADLLINSLPSIDISEDVDDERYERDLLGHWNPCGTNPDALFARYPSHGSFAPHTDGRAIINFNTRSFYSIIVFLNTVPLEQGAGTRFYSPQAIQQLELRTDRTGDASISQWTANKAFLQAEVQAVAGRMVLFQQAWVHEGVPPTAPNRKYIIRSDVIFRRDPPICDSPADQEAYQFFREAEWLAESGHVDNAVALFKKAFKRSALLAQIMGQA